MPFLTALVAITRMPVEIFDTESLLAILCHRSFTGCHEGAGHIVESPPFLNLLLITICVALLYLHAGKLCPECHQARYTDSCIIAAGGRSLRE